MVWLARMLIASFMLFSFVGILSLKFTVPRIIEVLLVILVFFHFGRLAPISETTRSLMKWTLTLIFVKFIIDNTVHIGAGLERFQETSFFLLRETFVVLMLPVFEKIRFSRIRVVETTILAAVPAVILGFLQIRNRAFNLPSIFSEIEILAVPSVESHLIQSERVVGPFDTAVTFGLVLGILCVIAWTMGFVGGTLKRKMASLAIFVVVYGLIIFTQTRSAIYGIFPSLLLAYLIAGRKPVRKVVVVGIAGLSAFFVFAGFESFVMKYSSRAKMVIDANTYYKITANIYGTYGALTTNPFFGIPRPTGEEDDETEFRKVVTKGQRELGTIVEAPKETGLSLTNHNLFSYYARFYGLIGFCLLVIVILKMLKKIRKKADYRVRFMLYGLLFFFLQYSLLHNSKLMQCLLLWVFLGFGREVPDNDFGPKVEVPAG